METKPRQTDNGPSYYDVSAYAADMRERRGTGIRWSLVPPIRRIDGRGYSSWSCRVEVWSLRTTPTKTWYAQAGFGQGGAWKTLPAALLATLRAIEAQWEDERVASEARAGF